MSELQEGRKRNRRLYTRNGDFDILKAAARYQFLTVEQTAAAAKRNVIAVRRRMLGMYDAGILNRARRDKLAPYVYFLAEKGSATCVERGYLSEPRWIKSKSSLIVSHDLEITNFHLVLEKALHDAGHTLSWEQWRGATRVQVETDAGMESLIPDATLTIDRKSTWHFEVVKSYESEYEKGESNIEHKIFLYNEYAKQSKEPFRVLWIFPTQERVLRLLTKIEERFPYRRFYFTDEASYKRDILGGIWWTPRDFRDAVHSLFEPKS